MPHLPCSHFALHYLKGPIKLKEIAKRQGISVPYLEHLLIHLKTAGLVVSTRGAIGGFTLAKPPSQIRLGEIIRGSEGCVDLAECLVDSRHAYALNSASPGISWRR